MRTFSPRILDTLRLESTIPYKTKNQWNTLPSLLVFFSCVLEQLGVKNCYSSVTCWFRGHCGFEGKTEIVNSMKTIKQAIIGAVSLSLVSAVHTFAIERLQISIQSSNVVLSWPSATNETYLIQYRPTLDTSSSWTTLTDYYPAAIGTNVTFFVHSNIVRYPLVLGGGTNTGSTTLLSSDSVSSTSSSSTTTTTTASTVPMVKPVSGSGVAVPMAIYPPGFSLNGYEVYYPSIGEWMSGNGYTVPQSSTSSTQTTDIQPMDSAGGSTNQYAGFYRVVQDGVQIYGLTNGMILSNEVITPIELAVPFTDQVVGVTFYDGNTNPIAGAIAQSLDGNSNVWFMEWNTTMSFNGTYDLYAELDFASNNSLFSAPVTVTVKNLICFPNEMAQTFGNQMWIYAQTIPNANYQLDLYDQNTNYLGSFTGTSDANGAISFLWNLVDASGNPTSSSTYYGVYTVDTSSLTNSSVTMQVSSAPAVPFQTAAPRFKTMNPPSASPQGASSTPANAQYFWSREPAWSYNGPWVIAYGQFAPTGSTLNSADINMITGDTLPQHGIMLVLDPNHTGLNISPGNNSSAVFTVNNATTAGQLLGYLEGGLFGNTYRNFWFFGHGNNHEIGNKSRPYPSGGDLTQDQIAFGLGNVPLSYQYAVSPSFGHPFPWVTTVAMPTTIQHAALHPYRFVYLDGCDTGASTLSEAFGIPSVTLTTNDFAANGVESRVFIGYKSWKIDNISQLNWENYSAMMYNFMYAWVTGTLNAQQCVAAAKQDNWPNPLPNYVSANMDSSVVVYGAADMFSYTHTGQ